MKNFHLVPLLTLAFVFPLAAQLKPPVPPGTPPADALKALKAEEVKPAPPVTLDTPAVWAQDHSDLKADPKITFGKLDNGVRYAILPHAEPPKRVSLRIYIDAGSLMEEDNQQGLAHFLEHMAFNGTTHYPSDEMVEFFQRLGMAFGADTNAHTGFKETVYKLELPEAGEALMDKGMLFFSDVAGSMLLAEKELEKERGVILSEKLARDNVDYRTMIEGFKFTLPDSLIPRRLPIGTEEVIKSAPHARFEEFYKKWYTPDRMAVVVVGDVDPALVKKVITARFSELKAPAKPAADPDLGPVTAAKGIEARLLTEKEAGQVTLSIDSSHASRKRPDIAATRREDLVRGLADAIVNRRFEILAKKPGAPFLAAQAGYDDWMRYVESSTLQIGSKPENWDKALAVGEQEIRRAVKYGFTAAELAEMKANILTGYENAARGAATRKSRELADRLVKFIADHNVFTTPEDDLALVKKHLESITAEECHEAFARDWATDSLRIFAGGNLELEDAPAKITAAWKASAATEVTAPEEAKDSAFAYTDFGPSGKIVKQDTVADLGITQLTFANNVRLSIKPTDFKKDTIQISCLFGEGELSLPKDKPGLDTFTSSVFEMGGLEKHSVDDLQRLLAGRTVGTNFVPGDDAFLLAGKTNRKDLLLQFQLMAATLQSPGWREDGVSLFRENLPAMYQQIAHTAEGVMQTQVGAFTHGNDYRFVLPPQEVLASRTMEEAKAWLQPALSTGYLEIGVVGDLDPREVITAASATFGALPARAAAKADNPKARELKFPADVKEKDFPFTSKIPKSVVAVYWPTTDRMKDIRTSRQMSLLAEILSDRVRLKVREELGESYSPNVASSMSDSFPGYGQMLAIMISQPKDAKQLGDIVRELADKLAKEGATDDELDRARKPLLTALDEQRRNNAYWLGTVVAPGQSQPQRLDWARTMVEDFKSVKLEDLNALAKKYLPATRAVVTCVVPEQEKDSAPERKLESGKPTAAAK
ncbi:MAG: peptidase [Verrucomicrobiales bacterium]|nr:peptidase [Verrucomicrobiales bacterium]